MPGAVSGKRSSDTSCSWRELEERIKEKDSERGYLNTFLREIGCDVWMHKSKCNETET